MHPSQTDRSLSVLMCPRRFSPTQEAGALAWEHRTPYETDGDKISFTEGFRALADKTQVHDRVTRSGNHRNRLTHSMEVSRVGRSLGVAVGSRMIGWYGLHAPASTIGSRDLGPIDIGHVVAAACLAHDIGNPPMGHDGEDVISDFFATNPVGMRAASAAGKDVGAELRCHEGNAQGFRMITRSMGWRESAGLNLTAATLAAFGKYPFPLREGKRKYGLHRADLDMMAFVAEATGMQADGDGWLRHPLAWLMEAADDICYLTVDLEDAAGLGVIALEELCELFTPIVGKDQIKVAREMRDPQALVQYLRSQVIKSLISGCVDAYPAIAQDIDRGDLSAGASGGGLVGASRHAEQMEMIRQFSRQRIYASPETQAARSRLRVDMAAALEFLVSDLLEHLDNADEVIRCDARRRPALERLPCARLGAKAPRDADLAMRWLVDQLTLLSDAEVIDLAELSRRG